MSRLIDLDTRGQMLWLSFPWDAQVQAVVKTLPGRQWDDARRQWSVPMAGIVDVVAALEPFYFKMTPRCRDFWRAESLQNAVPPSSEPVVDINPDDGMTVAALNRAARAALSAEFTAPIWVVAEVDGWSRNRPGRHAYFELVERDTVRGEIVALVKAVMFSRTRQRVETKLDGEVALEDGAMLRVLGRVELYEPRGQYQFVVEDIDAEWAVGARKRKRDRILAELERLGIIDDNNARPVPACPTRIGLITAIDSDAYNDFVHELERSGLPFDVTVVPATMQGPNMAPSVLQALRWFYRNAADFDVVAVVRGGGARSDLTHFDSLELGRAVCYMPMKIVCGVGHHRDRSVLDFVAHSEKTPTAAAQWIVRQVAESAQTLDDLAARLERAALAHVDAHARRLERCAGAWQRRADHQLAEATRRFMRAANSVSRAAESTLKGSEQRVAEVRHRLERVSLRCVDRSASKLDHAARGIDARRLTARMLRDHAEVERGRGELERAVTRRLSREGLRVAHLNDTLRLADPRRVVERGFAIVRDEAGAIVSSAAQLRAAGRGRVELRDGIVTVVPTDEENDD